MKLLLLLAMGTIMAFLVTIAVSVATGSDTLGFAVGGIAAFSLGIAAARDSR